MVQGLFYGVNSAIYDLLNKALNGEHDVNPAKIPNVVDQI